MFFLFVFDLAILFIIFRFFFTLLSFCLQFLPPFLFFIFFGLGSLFLLLSFFLHNFDHHFWGDRFIEAPFFFPFVDNVLLRYFSPIIFCVSSDPFNNFKFKLSLLDFIFDYFDYVGMVLEDNSLKKNYIWFFYAF